ncbi:MAG: sporulation protein YunB [Clostridiales bacterium]|nr:sporulation protein YunB [Clostridiales bacterium]
MVLFHKKHTLKPIIFTLFLLIMLFFGLKKIDERLFPSAEAIGTAYAADYINKQIDLTAKKIAEEKGVSYADFFTLSETNGEVSQIITNSLLINEFCSETAAALSDALFKTEIKKIPLSLGLLTGIGFLSNMGPKINYRIVPTGITAADYETSLTSAGINRINYRIFINITASISITSPLTQKPFKITRKYMLVDTVFSGSVPDTYLNIEGTHKN